VQRWQAAHRSSVGGGFVLGHQRRPGECAPAVAHRPVGRAGDLHVERSPAPVSQDAAELGMHDLTPSPATGSPTVSSGGQADAQPPEQLDTLRSSRVYR
jgi:hypothetical protein